jgi:hypothetical protein
MRELNEVESLELTEDGLCGDVDEDAHLDGEDGYAVRKGKLVGWELDGKLYAYEMLSVKDARAKFKFIVAENP